MNSKKIEELLFADPYCGSGSQEQLNCEINRLRTGIARLLAMLYKKKKISKYTLDYILEKF